MVDLKGIAGRVRDSRRRLGISSRELARRAGLKSESHASKVERGETEVSISKFMAIAAALDVDPVWLATGVETTGWVSRADIALLGRWRAVDDEPRRHLEALVNELAGRRADVMPIRPATVELPLVSLAAAGEPWPDGDAGELGRVEVPANLASDGAVAVMVRGKSMANEHLVDGDFLVVRPASLGRYRRGDCVIAVVNGGVVVKKYGGQRRGIITLESASEGHANISGPRSEDGGATGVEIRGVVVDVIRDVD